MKGLLVMAITTVIIAILGTFWYTVPECCPLRHGAWQSDNITNYIIKCVPLCNMLLFTIECHVSHGGRLHTVPAVYQLTAHNRRKYTKLTPHLITLYNLTPQHRELTATAWTTHLEAAIFKIAINANILDDVWCILWICIIWSYTSNEFMSR